MVNYLGVLLPNALVAKDNAFSWLDVKPSADFISSQVHMQSKDRADLKGLLRHSKKYLLEIVSLKGGGTFPRKEILILREAMRKAGKRAVDYFDDQQLVFVETIFDRSGCDVALLWEGESLVAANILLKKGNRVLSWVFFYTDPRASTALYVKYLSEVNFQSDMIFDFGVGVYSYKIGTFRPRLNVTFSLRYGKSMWRHIACMMDASIRWLKDCAKIRIRKRKMG